MYCLPTGIFVNNKFGKAPQSYSVKKLFLINFYPISSMAGHASWHENLMSWKSYGETDGTNGQQETDF